MRWGEGRRGVRLTGPPASSVARHGTSMPWTLGHGTAMATSPPRTHICTSRRHQSFATTATVPPPRQCPHPQHPPRTQGCPPSPHPRSLGRLEVAVDDLVEVQVVHAAGDAHGPIHQERRGDLAPGTQHLVELTLGAELHDDAVAGRLGAHTPAGTGQRQRGAHCCCGGTRCCGGTWLHPVPVGAGVPSGLGHPMGPGHPPASQHPSAPGTHLCPPPLPIPSVPPSVPHAGAAGVPVAVPCWCSPCTRCVRGCV